MNGLRRQHALRCCRASGRRAHVHRLLCCLHLKARAGTACTESSCASPLRLQEMKCDPEVERCRTPIHVWESKCATCSGSGIARGGSSHRSRRGPLAVCLLCHGLGYVRHSSTHAAKVPHVNGAGPHTTIGRPPSAERKPPRQWPLPGSMQYRPPPRRP